jgi:hypothetical protein
MTSAKTMSAGRNDNGISTCTVAQRNGRKRFTARPANRGSLLSSAVGLDHICAGTRERNRRGRAADRCQAPRCNAQRVNLQHRKRCTWSMSCERTSCVRIVPSKCSKSACRPAHTERGSYHHTNRHQRSIASLIPFPTTAPAPPAKHPAGIANQRINNGPSARHKQSALSLAVLPRASPDTRIGYRALRKEGRGRLRRPRPHPRHRTAATLHVT